MKMHTLFISLLVFAISFSKAQTTIPSVTICTQVWMLKNLDVSTYRNGDLIPKVTDPTAWSALTTGAWCWYNNDSATNASTYGKLYNWYAVNDPRGLAPTGWHVPSDSEWTTLSTCLGGDAVAGGAMKETGTTHWTSPNTGATNTSGFTALPGGYRIPNVPSYFLYVGDSGFWWSSTEAANTSFAWTSNLDYTYADFSRNWDDKSFGFSVRCLRDTPPVPVIATLTTTAASAITATTATSGGNITNDGGATITARGVCWNTSVSPTIANSKTIDGTGTGIFASSVTGLTAGTIYYIRAYATNSAGTAYGNELNFTTISSCTQGWMLKNLDVSTYRNGDPIPEVTDLTAWLALTTGAWCWYNNDSATNASTYGKLYNWYAVNDPRGLAPTGWHVPSDAEWTTLSTCLGGDSVAGGAMKETGTTHWQSPNTDATNSSSFTGLPGGDLGPVGFENVGNVGVWWSSTENSTVGAWTRILGYTYGSIIRNGYSKQVGFSVRCLRDLYSDTVTVKLIDPNPSLILTNGILNTNFSGLDTTKIVKGAATDGVTKVLLYCNSTSPIRFSIADTSNGTLSDLASQNTYSSNITIQPVNGKVIVVFNAPDGYGNNTNNQTTRQTSIKAVTLNSTDTTKINLNLITPPVVLVHGMWSRPSVWVEGGFKDSLVNRGFELPVLANYEASNSTTFNPNSPESGEGRSAVQKAIDSALSHYHKDLNIAATQVDVVGHSLGGLMARSYSQQTTFKDISNYNKGYIHKLITLCTPHRGSPLGPEMWNQRNAIVSFSGIPSPLSIAMRLAGYPIGSCHRDFAIQSDGIKALTQTLPFKTFSIEADYTGQTAGYIKMNVLTVFATGKPINLIMYSRCLTGGILTNDLVVPLSSQRGFVNNGKDFLFVNTAHSAPGNNTVTNSSDVQNKVAGLLLSNNPNDFGTGYPAPDSLPLDCTNASERNAGSKNNSNDKITTSQRIMGNQAIHISSPISGATYQEGSGVNITLAFTTSGGAIPTNSMFMVKDIGWFPATNTPPYTTSFILPQNSPIGNISVLVLAIDSTGLRMADSSHITITPTGTLDSISVDPGKIILDSVTRTSSIYVSGYYHNGGVKSFHDLTDSTTGTVYSSQHNNVFKVNANGYLTAKGPGTDSLVISNGGKTIKILVTVSSNFQQAVLFPNTIDFPVIADATVGDNPFGLSASASSGDNVTFSLVSGSAVISNGIMTLNGPGAITVKASQVGNVYFAPAADVLRTFCVKSVSAIISADTSSFCSSGTVTLTSNATSGNQWYKDGVALSGSSATNLKVTASGSYTVKVTVSGCESAASNSIVVTANSVPTLTLIRDTILLSSSALNYRWFFNNNTINGETTNSIRVRKTGFYRVETSPNKVCWTPSIDFPILILSDPLINDTLSMDVYPNPTPDNFNVVVRLQKVTNVTAYVTISNVSGSVVLQTNKLILFTNEVKIPVNLNMKGSFFVKVYINGDVKTMPVIIQ